MNVLEELTDEEARVDKDYVERRVADWTQRIERLYLDVASWLQEGWQTVRAGEVPMREELMERFGVPERRLPLLVFKHDGVARARMEPRGLWIIGANGRIDLVSSTGRFLIVDRAESFDPPDWKVASINNRRQQRSFDRQALRDLLA